MSRCFAFYAKAFCFLFAGSYVYIINVNIDVSLVKCTYLLGPKQDALLM